MNCEIIATYSDEREKVLRNTYSLLAVSLLPTVFGAYIGLHFDVLKMLGGVVSIEELKEMSLQDIVDMLADS